MKKILTGRVTSDRMDKTIVVEVESIKKHPLYGKRYRSNKKYYVHDPAELGSPQKARAGDLVEIQESRPMSKTKRWKLIKILKKEEQR